MRSAKDLAWELFKETGNISYYCLYRSLGGSSEDDYNRRNSDKNGRL